MANEIHVNIWNGGWVNLLEQRLAKVNGEITHQAMPEISKAVAKHAAANARRIIRENNVDWASDGNKIDGVSVVSTGTRSSVYLDAPHKDGSEYSDAVYVEYGYGPKGVYSKFNNDPDFIAKRPSGYAPSEGSNKIRYNPHYGEEGWFFYNQHWGGLLQWSGGEKALAPMYRSKKNTLAQLRKPNSSLRKRIQRIIDKAIQTANK